jgi:hypothetical protein
MDDASTGAATDHGATRGRDARSRCGGRGGDDVAPLDNPKSEVVVDSMGVIEVATSVAKSGATE